MLRINTRPPGPRSPLPIRELRALRQDVVGFLNHMATAYGSLSCVRVGPQLFCFVSEPDLIQDVLVTQHRSFQKNWLLPIAKDVLGQGMLTSTGDYHRRQRKLIQPALHKQRIAGYAEIMIRAADRTGREWREGASVDMAREMMALALSIVVQTLFGSDIDEEAEGVGRAITQLTETYEQLKSPVMQVLSRLPFLPSNRRAALATERLNATIYRLIAQRREAGERRDDLLAMLLDAQSEEDGRGMTDRQVRDEAVALFLAGHETTSNVLTWTWYLLSQHPEAEAELHAELEAVLGGRLPEPGDLERLPYTRKFIAEALRLYPPAYLVPRRAVESCELGNCTIPAGTLVFVCIYTVQRDPRYFPDPERFDPHRWTPEMKEALPKYAYCPFGGGPHACLGDHFAWAEAMLVMAVLAQRWRARVVPGHTVTLNPLVNLRPRGGMPMMIASRQVHR